MAAARSPNYPQMDLGAALEAIKTAYKEERRNKMSKAVLAGHLGYNSVNGRALAKIGAVRAYGLIEGKEDELRISEDAIDCIEAPEGSAERSKAIFRCAFNPPIFQEIRGEYEGRPSEHNLRFYLIKRGYTPEAASRAAQNYLSTVRLVEDSGAANDTSFTEENAETEAVETPRANPAPLMTVAQIRATAAGVGPLSANQMDHLPGAGMTQAVFPLAEGNVFLTFPAQLTSDGYAELAEYLQIFLRRAERAKKLEEAREDFKDPPTQ